MKQMVWTVARLSIDDTGDMIQYGIQSQNVFSRRNYVGQSSLNCPVLQKCWINVRLK